MRERADSGDGSADLNTGQVAIQPEDETGVVQNMDLLAEMDDKRNADIFRNLTFDQEGNPIQ